jgi:hypothetical protein
MDTTNNPGAEWLSVKHAAAFMGCSHGHLKTVLDPLLGGGVERDSAGRRRYHRTALESLKAHRAAAVALLSTPSKTPAKRKAKAGK